MISAAASDMDELLAQIRALPQGQHIPDERAVLWLERVAQVEAERAAWHVRRARGFGGSEMGALVASYEERPTYWANATDIVRNKLMITPPERPNVDMARGQKLEPFIREVFEAQLEEKYGSDGYRRREDLEAKLHADHEGPLAWLVSNTDGIYEVQGAIAIVDFKAPTPDVIDGVFRYGVSEDYVFQLHHYWLDCMVRGIGVDHLVLAPYNYKAHRVEMFDVPKDENLLRTIETVGNFYWNEHVLEGEVPAVRTRSYAEMDIPPEVEAEARVVIVTRGLGAQLKAMEDEARTNIDQWLQRNVTLGDERGVLSSYLQLKGSQVLNIDAALQRLRDLGYSEDDLEGLRLEDEYDHDRLKQSWGRVLALAEELAAIDDNSEGITAEEIAKKVVKVAKRGPKLKKGAFDPQKIQDALVFCMDRPEKYMEEQISMSLPRGKNQRWEDQRQRLQEFASSLVNRLTGNSLARFRQTEPVVEAETKPRIQA